MSDQYKDQRVANHSAVPDKVNPTYQVRNMPYAAQGGYHEDKTRWLLVLGRMWRSRSLASMGSGLKAGAQRLLCTHFYSSIGHRKQEVEDTLLSTDVEKQNAVRPYKRTITQPSK
jgi:hypothetical protein